MARRPMTPGFEEPLAASQINWKNGRQVGEWVRQEVRRGEMRRGNANRIARRNIFWYCGNQEYEWSNVELSYLFTRRINELQEGSNYQANYIRRAVNHFVATLLRSNPVPRVAPATDQEDDALIARYGTGVCKYYERIENLRQKLRLALIWAGVVGTGAWLVTWNPSKGQEIDIRRQAPNEFADIPGDLASLIGGATKPGFSVTSDARLSTELRLGDIEVKIASRLEFTLPEGYSSEQEMPWVIHSCLMDRIEARGIFGKIIDQVPNPEPRAIDGGRYLNLSHGRIDSTSGYPAKSEWGDNASNQDLILVHRVWRRRDAEYPEGVYAAYAEGFDRPLVKPEPNPFPHGAFPVVFWRVAPGLGSFDGLSLVSEMVPAQRAFNKVNQRILDNAREVAKIRYLAHQSSGITPAQFGPKGPSLLKWRGIHKPEVMDIKPVPPQYAEILSMRLQKTIFELAGIEDVAMGKQPGSVRAASGIRAMMERADITVADAVEMLNETYGSAFQQILKLFSAFADEERIIRVRGEGNEFETMYLRGDNLVGQDDRVGVNYFDVYVYAEAGIPESQSVRIQKVLALSQIQGALQMPSDRVRLFKMLGLGGSEEDIDPLAGDRAAAQRAITRLERGETYQPMPYMNHEVFVKALKRWAGTSLKFERLTRQNPQLPNIVNQLVDAHVQLGVMEKLKPQAMAASLLNQAGMGQAQGRATASPPGQRTGQRRPAAPSKAAAG